jgi:hypothetical protein
MIQYGDARMIEILLALAALLTSQAMQAVDDFLSHSGVVSVAHGCLLGYGQVYVAKMLLEWGGASLGWLVVSLIALGAVVVSAIKIYKMGSRWIFAFNFGVLCGIIYGGIDLV